MDNVVTPPKGTSFLQKLLRGHSPASRRRRRSEPSALRRNRASSYNGDKGLARMYLRNGLASQDRIALRVA